MKNKIQLALLALALGVATHGYLVLHYYPLHYGFATGESICNISTKFNCDAISASAYSSVFGIPIAAFGAAFNLFLFLFVLLTWLGMTGNQEKSWRASLWLSLSSVLVSLVMSSISIFALGSYCLFCMFAYGLSIISAGAILWAQPTSPWPHFKADLTGLLTVNRTFAVWLLAIPIVGVLIHAAMIQNFGAGELDKVVASAVSDWQGAPPLQLTTTPALIKGATPENAKMTIVEFADFRCSHCRQAAPSLDAFAAAHPDDVRFLYFTWPLDGKCNPAMNDGDGISCELARAAICGERQKLGWEVHETIYTHQEAFYKTSTVEAANNELKRLLKDHPIDWEKFTTCLKDPEVDASIKAQSQQGMTANIRGTPTIFVNGKLLERGQVIPVLEAVRNILISK